MVARSFGNRRVLDGGAHIDRVPALSAIWPDVGRDDRDVRLIFGWR